MEKEDKQLNNENNEDFDVDDYVGIDIYNLNNEKILYEFDLSKKVSDLLESLRKEEGVGNDVCLFFNGQYLDNDKTLKSCGVVSLSELYLKKKDESKINLRISSDQKEIVIEVKPDCLCQDILDEYKKAVNIEYTKTIVMSFGGKTLKSTEKISSYGITNGNKIDIFSRLKGGIKDNSAHFF